jgi:linoleoyl-CoA desaturase
MKLPEFKNENLHKKWIQTVNEYFSKNKISKTDNLNYYLKFFILLSIWIVCWSFLTFYNHNIINVILSSIFLGFITAILGINSMHDGGHFSTSKYKFLNNLFAYVSDVMGASSFFWKIKHNVLHHTYTNINSLDDDLNAGVVARLSPQQNKKYYHKYQHIYMIPLYGLLMFKWNFLDDYICFFKKSVSFKEIEMSKKDKFMFFFGKFINLCWLILIPSFFHSFKLVVTETLLIYFSTGLVISLIFIVAHLVEGVKFMDADQDLNEGFFEHQLSTTTDFSINSKLALFISGGLNYQTVHHLTPSINHMHYQALSKLLEKFCKENNLNYKHFPDYKSAFKSHFKFLKSMGT